MYKNRKNKYSEDEILTFSINPSLVDLVETEEGLFSIDLYSSTWLFVDNRKPKSYYTIYLTKEETKSYMIFEYDDIDNAIENYLNIYENPLLVWKSK